MSAVVLEKARKSLWFAIDNWPPLMLGGDAPLTKKYKFNDPALMLADVQPSSSSELPALAIFPETLTPEELLREGQDYPYPLKLHFWTRDWILPLAETMWEHLVDASFQSIYLPINDVVPVVKSVTGYYPDIGALSFTRVQLGKEQQSERAIYGTFVLTLRQTFSPYQ